MTMMTAPPPLLPCNGKVTTMVELGWWWAAQVWGLSHTFDQSQWQWRRHHQAGGVCTTKPEEWCMHLWPRYIPPLLQAPAIGWLHRYAFTSNNPRLKNLYRRFGNERRKGLTRNYVYNCTTKSMAYCWLTWCKRQYFSEPRVDEACHFE